MVPSPQDIARHRNTIRYFFDEVCNVVYHEQISYDSISLALFIDSRVEKELLELMERRFAVGDYKSTVFYGRRVVAYHLRLLRKNLGIPHSPRNTYGSFSGIEQIPGLRDVARTLEDVTKASGWLMSRFVLQDYYEEVSELLEDDSPLSVYSYEQPKLEEADRAQAENVRDKVYNFLSDSRWRLQELDLTEPFIYKVVASDTNGQSEVEIGFATNSPATKCVITISELGAPTEPVEIAGPISPGVHTVRLPPFQRGKYYTVGVTVDNKEGRDYDSFGIQIPT